MRFEDIQDHILNSINQYELQHGIKTLRVDCFIRNDNWACFVAEKSDGSRTLFYARRGKRADNSSWQYFCPSKSEIREAFPQMIEYYEENESVNTERRMEVA
jgi:hypothetical protein